MAFLAPVVALATANAGALGLVGAATSAVGGIMGGEATAASASYQAQVAKNNAAVAYANAQRASAAGQEQAAQTSEKGAQQEAQIIGAMAANNIDVRSGSAVDVERGSREVNELNSETVLSNAELQNYGYRVQANSDAAQAKLYETEAAEAPIAADIGAAGGLLGAASSIGMKYGSISWSGQGSTDPNLSVK